MPELDTLTETAARWLAQRTTRRSFLGRLGRGAVFVAGGSTLATVLTAGEAEARVCGQSGVSPKCPTYDCDDVWGWCWYASGCCAGGHLKKICDCCRADHPNVHGYCPSGTNVLCIVESCGTDPRVQVVALRQVRSDDPVVVSAGLSRLRFSEGEGPAAWLVDAAQPLAAAAFAPAAARARAPMLLTRGTALAAATVAELQRLGTKTAVLAGTGLGPAVEHGLRSYGITPERRHDGADLAATAQQVAGELLAGGARRAVCVESVGTSPELAALGAGFAAAKGYPVVIGVDRARELASAAAANRPALTYLIGPDASARAGEIPGGHPFHSSDPAALSAEIADVAFQREPVDAGRVALVAAGSVGLHAALSMAGPILVHAPGSLEGVRDILFASRDRLRLAGLCGATNALPAEGYYELQSILNGFDAHKLIGVAGQGLPVIEQPESERPVGLARVSSAPRVRAESRYWTGRVQDL